MVILFRHRGGSRPGTSTRRAATLLDRGLDAAAFDELALSARRKLSRRVDKSDILVALIMLAVDDVSLHEQVIDEVARCSK